MKDVLRLVNLSKCLLEVLTTALHFAQIYGKDDVFDVERLIDLLSAFESFREASQSARGDMDSVEFAVPTQSAPDTGREASGMSQMQNPYFHPLRRRNHKHFSVDLHLKGWTRLLPLNRPILFTLTYKAKEHLRDSKK